MELWTSKGKTNTNDTLAAALRKAKDSQINHIVFASNSGQTGQILLDLIQEYSQDADWAAFAKNLNLVCVTHHVGFMGPGVDELSPEARQSLSQANVKVLTTTHLFAGLDRAVRNKFGGVYPAEIMAQTLRIFGQGIKVAVEVAGMAVDAGLIPHGEEVISIGGYARGADSALIIIPAHSNKFFDTVVQEIICMPRVK